MGDDGRTPLSADEVHDLIDSWEVDPAVETLEPATELLATMSVGDPGRLDVLQVIADHQAMRGDVDGALTTLDRAAAPPSPEADVVEAMRVSFLVAGDRHDEAEPLLRELRSRGSTLPAEAIQRVAESLEDTGRLRDAMRWHTIALRDLDPQQDLPTHDEEDALIGRWRVRQALALPADHYDALASTTLDLRRARHRDDHP